MDKKNDNGDPKPQRKMKFMPKKPPRREQKLVLPKPEKVEDAETEEVKAQELLKRFNEASKKPKFKTETKPSKTRVSSFSFGSTPKSGGDAAATPGITMKEYKEPWDYYKNYPVTLPLLDEQEFKVDSETNAYDESSVKAAEELGLMQAAKTEGGEAATSSKPSKPTGPGPKACSLKELPSGFMGKMLVYKSGAVKLKLGDHLYNDVVVINTDEKHCCNVGELNKRAIITPDIDSLLLNPDHGNSGLGSDDDSVQMRMVNRVFLFSYWLGAAIDHHGWME
ncbi:RNA polymerase III Rpc4, partial [Cynara cardunculus var. scolymus]